MLRDAHYASAKKLGHGVGYIDPHTNPDAAAQVDYLPEELRGRRYYRPSGQGEEGNGEEADGHDRDG
jgi:putative ATPase